MEQLQSKDQKQYTFGKNMFSSLKNAYTKKQQKNNAYNSQKFCKKCK